jgi:hypothetical protein
MQDPHNPPPGEPQNKGEWRRPLSYLLLIIGAAGIFFNSQLSQATGLPVAAFQIGTFVLFVAGAILFLSVKQTTDRVSTYRDVFSASQRDKPDAEPDPNLPEPPGPSDKPLPPR